MNDSTLEVFANGDCDPRSFPHSEHVRMGFEMLRRLSFPETVLFFTRALRKMAARAGKPEAYHETITIAFLSLIAEGMGDTNDYKDFAARNPELFDKRVLARWYRPERLASDRARHTFVLPEPVA